MPRSTLALRPNPGPGRLVVEVSRSHAVRHTISGRTPLNGWSALRRGRYLQNTQQTQEKTLMPSEGFEPTIPAIKLPQTCALDRAANGMGGCKFTSRKLLRFLCLIMPWTLVKQQMPYSSFLAASRVAGFVSKELPFGIQVCWYAMLCCAVPCCAVLCCAVLCCAVLCCAVLCCAVLCCAVLCCAVLCYAVLCYAMLCYAMLCRAVLCYAMLCCAL